MNKRRLRYRGRNSRLGIAPTPERRKQNGGVIAERIIRNANDRGFITRYRAVWSCPLDAYRDSNFITRAEHLAGIIFHKAYYGSVLCRAAHMERLGNCAASDRLSPHERILKQAYRTLSFPSRKAVINICGHEEPARDEKKLQELRRGLGELARCWNTAAMEVTGHKP